MCWAGSGGAGYSRVPACIVFLSPSCFACLSFLSIFAWMVRSVAAVSSASWAKRSFVALRERRLRDCVMAQCSLRLGSLTSRLFLFRNLLALFARLREADGDGLLAAFHLTALAALAAL